MQRRLWLGQVRQETWTEILAGGLRGSASLGAMGWSVGFVLRLMPGASLESDRM